MWLFSVVDPQWTVLKHSVVQLKRWLFSLIVKQNKRGTHLLSPELNSILKSALSHGSGHIFGLWRKHWCQSMFSKAIYSTVSVFKLSWKYHNVPLGHTPWAAVWLPGSQTGWPRRQECLEWPPAVPSLPLRPSCCPGPHTQTHTERS